MAGSVQFIQRIWTWCVSSTQVDLSNLSGVSDQWCVTPTLMDLSNLSEVSGYDAFYLLR